MIDKKFLDSMNFKTRSAFQSFLAKAIVGPNFRLSNVSIEIENLKNIPENETVIYAMNHTDRYNYIPFQYSLIKMKNYPETTVWVKAKYFSNAVIKKVLRWGNTLPVPTRAYFIEMIFKKTFNRKINPQEYRLIKDIMDMKVNISDALHSASQDISYLFSDKWEKLMDSKLNFVKYIDSCYDQIMNRVAELSRSALLEKNLSLLIFPEGTRSVKLIEGKTGIAQIALSTGKKVIPVACNGSEKIYPGNIPLAKKGKVIYRIGEPISVDNAFREYRIDENFKVFSKEAQEKYGSNFEAVSGIIMKNIQDMLDDNYREPA